MSVVLQIFCWLALAVTALGATVMFGVAHSYYPNGSGPALFAAIAAPILIAVLLVLVHRVRRGPLNHFLAILDGGLGLLLGGFGLFFIVTDPGDLVLYFWPLLLGIGLLFLAFESKQGRAE